MMGNLRTSWVHFCSKIIVEQAVPTNIFLTLLADWTAYFTQTIYPDMRPALLRLFTAICFIYFSTHLSAQNCFNTGLNGTVINLPCNQNCVNVPVRIPHLKGTSSYTVNNVPYNT